MSTNSAGYASSRNPIAQSFYVEQTEGIYLTKVDLYFSETTSAAPVSLHIRPMENGLPSASKIIPSSTVYVSGSSVGVSADATTPTSFEFEEPVYLDGQKEFALVLVTPHPAFKLWIAQIDEYEVGTTASRVARNPAAGSLFYSHSGSTWTPAQNQDMKFKLYRAKFNTGATGTAILENAALPLERLRNNPISTDSASSTITIAHQGHGFVVGDIVTLAGVDSATTIGGITGADIIGNRTISAVDYSGYQVTAGATSTSPDVGGGTTVTATRNIGYCNVYNNVSSLIPKGTYLSAGIKKTTGKSFAGTETPYQKDTSFASLPFNSTISYSKPYVVANNAIETTELGAGVKSLTQQLTLTTNSEYVAPMIDMQRASITLIDNFIDKQDSAATVGFNVPIEFANETSKTGGSSASKHITTPITLDEDAVGIKIFLDAYRPNGADFLVYYRTCTLDQSIYDQDYILLDEETNNPVDDAFRFREYRYLAGGLGGTLSAFTRFQIKIVMRSENKALVPYIKNLRAIALSV